MSCDCNKLQRLILEADLSNLPDTIREEANRCPHCKQALERALTIQQLVSLKRHEKPDSFSERRCVNRVRLELEERASAPAGFQGVFEQLTDALAAPSFRYGLAAVFVGLLAIQVVTWQKLPVLDPVASEENVQPVDQGSAHLLASTNPAPSIPSHQAPRPQDADPGSIQYGPAPTVPVSIDF